MNIPKIDLDTLPGLETKTGIYGSMSGGSGGHADDRVIAVMVYIYTAS